MNIIKPAKLKKGDTIGFLALSGAIQNKKNILRAKKYFEQKGYNVVFSDNIFDKNRYLAGTDKAKLQQLHSFFENPEINAILCARGGYGAIRLIDKIDYDLIKNNPKIFAGYSDVTAIELMIYKKTGLVTFYSPHAQSDFGIEKVHNGVAKSFFQTLTNVQNLNISPNIKGKVFFEGNAEGYLWGGNLATIASLCGQDFIPSEKFILFAEDLNENVYKIDKMFTQLLNIDKFRNNLQGIVLGDFLEAGNRKHLSDLFFEIASENKIPVMSGFKITHAPNKITLPNGAYARVSTDEKVLKIDSYLSD